MRNGSIATPDCVARARANLPEAEPAISTPRRSKAAALAVAVLAGAFTAQISGVGNATGGAPGEIYGLP